jgi:hypothetical protein
MWCLLIGLGLLLLVGSAVRPLVAYATDFDRPNPPKGIEEHIWWDIVDRGSGGSVLGHLERLLFFAAFWNGEPILVAGWLAFKVASGWQNWKLIVQVPDKMDGVDDLDYLRARSQLGSWIFHRFLIGTLGNVLAGLAAVTVAKYFWPG